MRILTNRSHATEGTSAESLDRYLAVVPLDGLSFTLAGYFLYIPARAIGRLSGESRAGVEAMRQLAAISSLAERCIYR